MGDKISGHGPTLGSVEYILGWPVLMWWTQDTITILHDNKMKRKDKVDQSGSIIFIAQFSIQYVGIFHEVFSQAKGE